jgi:hypothetical protein
MDERTLAHLRVAQRNRDLAFTLRDMSAVTPHVRGWAIVVAFYAAVHDVNAYLWERLRVEPRSHEERSRYVARLSDLQPIFAAYQRLLELSYQARYIPTFQVSAPAVDYAVESLLESIHATIRLALPVEE